MNKSRRKFLAQGALTVAGLTLLKSKSIANTISTWHITGLQLYTVRDDMKTPQGALDTLKKLSAMGYRYVEHANYVNRKFYGYTPAEFKKILQDLNLKMRSGHTVLDVKHWDAAKNDFTDVWKHTVEDAAFMEQKYVISPWMDEAVRTDMDKLKMFLDLFNKSGELCKKYNMKFGYHNHDFEVMTKLNDGTLYDFILQNTDPKLVAQQMDIGNWYGAGGRAIDVMKKYPGRFELMHVKDEIKAAKGEMAGEPYESTVLGKGVLDVKSIIDYAKANGGTTDFIIEQESYQGKAPVDCAKEDLAAMKNWGF